MSVRRYQPWQKEACDRCGCEFQVTRTQPRVFEDGQEVICGDCETYEKAESDVQKEVDELKQQVASLKADLDAARFHWFEKMHEARHVQTPCTVCAGSGVRAYPDTSTWRRGFGGAAITWDVCNNCWGSGDAERKGVDLLEFTQRTDQMVNARAANLLAQSAGCSAKTMRPQVKKLIEVIEAEGRKRKVTIWYRGLCDSIATTLRKAMEASEQLEEKS